MSLLLRAEWRSVVSAGPRRQSSRTGKARDAQLVAEDDGAVDAVRAVGGRRENVVVVLLNRSARQRRNLVVEDIVLPADSLQSEGLGDVADAVVHVAVCGGRGATWRVSLRNSSSLRPLSKREQKNEHGGRQHCTVMPRTSLIAFLL